MCWLPVVRASRASDSLSGSFSYNSHLGREKILQIQGNHEFLIISYFRWMFEQKCDMEEVEMMRHHLVHHVKVHGHHFVHHVKDHGHHLVHHIKENGHRVKDHGHHLVHRIKGHGHHLVPRIKNHGHHFVVTPSNITWQSKGCSHIMQYCN